MKLRTAVLVSPLDGDLDAAVASPADAIVFSLAEERVAVGTLRNRVLEAMPRVREAGKRSLVVVNHPRSRLLRDDLDAVVTPDLAGVLLTHAAEPQDIRDLAVAIREFEYDRGIEVGQVATFPVIDTARGLLRAPEIAAAAPRVAGLVLAAEAYAREIGARHEEQGSRLAYARGAVVNAARAHDLLPLVIANPFELRDLYQHGFAGVILPDASGVPSANMIFTPGRFRLERARAHVSAYDAARAEGAWVARVEDELVDSHAARKARQVMDQAEG